MTSKLENDLRKCQRCGHEVREALIHKHYIPPHKDLKMEKNRKRTYVRICSNCLFRERVIAKSLLGGPKSTKDLQNDFSKQPVFAVETDVGKVEIGFKREMIEMIDLKSAICHLKKRGLLMLESKNIYSLNPLLRKYFEHSFKNECLLVEIHLSFKVTRAKFMRIEESMGYPPLTASSAKVVEQYRSIVEPLGIFPFKVLSFKLMSIKEFIRKEGTLEKYKDELESLISKLRSECRKCMVSFQFSFQTGMKILALRPYVGGELWEQYKKKMVELCKEFLEKVEEEKNLPTKKAKIIELYKFTHNCVGAIGAIAEGVGTTGKYADACALDRNMGVPNPKRKMVLERDGNSCIRCGSVSDLEVHHCDGNHKNNKLSNLVTLCHECHHEFESYLIKKLGFDYYFSKHEGTSKEIKEIAELSQEIAELSQEFINRRRGKR